MNKLQIKLNQFPTLKKALINRGYNLNQNQLILKSSDARIAALYAFYDLQKTNATPNLHITASNSKLSVIPSLAVSPWLTCTNAPCFQSGACYGLKFHFLSILKFLNMIENTYLLNEKSDQFKKQLNAFFALNPLITFFRWFENGDFQSVENVKLFDEIARGNPNINFLAMTKKTALVNKYLDSTKGHKSDNLTIRFSKFTYNNFTEIENPYNLPLTDCIPNKKSLNRNAVFCLNSIDKKRGCASCLQCWRQKKEIDFIKH